MFRNVSSYFLNCYYAVTVKGDHRSSARSNKFVLPIIITSCVDRQRDKGSDVTYYTRYNEIGDHNSDFEFIDRIKPGVLKLNGARRSIKMFGNNCRHGRSIRWLFCFWLIDL